MNTTSNEPSKLGYITLETSEDTKLEFRQILNTLCTKDDFYYSDVVPRIAGDVTAILHLTLFFGLDPKQIDMDKLNQKISSIDIKELHLGTIALKYGYQGLYQILWATIEDTDNHLFNLSQEFGKFNPVAYNPHYTFLPHITLAYVKPEFKLNDNIKFPKVLDIVGAKYLEEDNIL